jgi:hypothetical protein
MDDKSAPVGGTGPIVPSSAGSASKATPAVPALPALPATDSMSTFPPTVRKKAGLSLEETSPLWDAFRAGKVVPCPNDGGSLALNVDGASAYRLVCTQCGTASSWFEAPPTGLRDRVLAPPQDEDPTDD